MRNRTKSQIIGDKAKTMGNAMQKHNQSHSRNLVEKELVGKH